jgi:hypothetical protein
VDPTIDFSHALRLCKAGSKITRLGWNGKGQYVVLQKGYPEGVAINANTAEALKLLEGSVHAFAPYLLLHNAQGVFVPWLASQGDLLAEDWTVTS